MSFPVYINSSNWVSGGNFKVSLPNSVDLSPFDVSVDQMFVYYSWYNISAALGNNQFQIKIPTKSSTITSTITLPDGAYNISTLNNYLQYWFLTNGYYAQNNSTGVYTYYGAFALSPQSYAVQWITTALPTSPATGYTYGSGWTTTINGDNLPTSSNQSIQLVVFSTNTFNQIIGFAAGTYPSSATISGTTYTAQSTLVPNVNPIYSVQCRLSCCYGRLSANSQLLHTFTNGSNSIGQLIDASPRFWQPVSCVGTHSELTFSMFDQNGNPLQLIDPNITVKLSFRRRDTNINIHS